MKDYIVSIQEVLAGRNDDFDKAAQANRVKFVRQKDNRNVMYIHGEKFDKFSIYSLYKHDRQNFLYYTGEQAKPIYSNVDYIVVFLGENSTTARLVGVFKNNGPEPTGKQYEECSPYNYDFSEAEGFEMLNEKVIIDWGSAAVSWHQYYNNIKPVIRIEAGLEDEQGLPIFSSYANVNVTLAQLKQIVEKNLGDWRLALKSVNCIYIITDHKNGKHYIGSIYNLAGGMWERWNGYATTNHNENKSLKLAMEADPNCEENFSWAILETLSLNIAPHDAIARENLYKEKFMTREFGYNDN